jgi:error-prone DNA polymerase
LHPLLEPALKKTLGVPLFQEQLMQMAIDAAGFSAAEADKLRQAVGSKRSQERMERLRGRLYDGLAAHGITGEIADRIYTQLSAFANYGFPESHAASFAYMVYSSAWLKLHYPAAFCAALLNAQPMGFWSPETLVADARRHGVIAFGPDVNASGADATLEANAQSATRFAVRLGIGSVREIGTDLANRIAAERPYASIEDLVRRTAAPRTAVESLADAGAFACFGYARREALWVAGATAHARPGSLPGVLTGVDPPALPAMTETEIVAADLASTGVSARRHPMALIRERLDEMGAVALAGLDAVPHATRVLVGGLVTHRQRPTTAGGTVFLNLEDETGLLNVICSRGTWMRYREIGRSAAALLVRGRLERREDAINLIAHRLETLRLHVPINRSRDFR